jgi:hypothetical protein
MSTLSHDEEELEDEMDEKSRRWHMKQQMTT